MNLGFRAAGILITPHVIATRVVREALASGVPIVAGNGNPYTQYVANYLDVHGFAAKINECWNDVKKDDKCRQDARRIAEREFNPKAAGKVALGIYERILKEVKNNPIIIPKPKGESPMIYNFIAYAQGDKENLGKTYNQYMELLKNDEDWACFLDHDAMFTTIDWYKLLQDVITGNPEYSLLTAVTNRIGNAQQKFANLKQTHDMVYHRGIGATALSQAGNTVMDVSNSHCISGVVMLIKKSAWKKAGGFKDGFLGIDNDFHKRIVKSGGKVGVCRGLYIYHWYRADESSQLKPIAV